MKKLGIWLGVLLVITLAFGFVTFSQNRAIQQKSNELAETAEKTATQVSELKDKLAVLEELTATLQAAEQTNTEDKNALNAKLDALMTQVASVGNSIASFKSQLNEAAAQLGKQQQAIDALTEQPETAAKKESTETFANEKKKTGSILGSVFLLAKKNSASAANRMKMLTDGMVVTVLEIDETGDWYYVEVDGVQGYVIASHIKVD